MFQGSDFISEEKTSFLRTPAEKESVGKEVKVIPGSSLVPRRKQHWRIGDVFLVPTRDGRFAIGQVTEQEPDLMRSATVALFDERHTSVEAAREDPACDPDTLYAILFVTVNHLESGDWVVVGNRSVTVDPALNLTSILGAPDSSEPK